MSHFLLQKSTVVQAQLRLDLPEFKVGSLVEVAYKIIEGGKERIQTFKGIVTNKHNATSLDATFTVVKNSTFNTKVERTFPVNSPLISSLVVTDDRRARRSNLRNVLEIKDPRKIRSRKVNPLKEVKVGPQKPAPKVAVTTEK